MDANEVVKMSYLIKIDNYLDSLKTGKNAAVDSWPLMSGPVPLVAILLAYLGFVLRLGPALMASRAPMKLTKLIIFYNAAQVFLSALVCYKCVRLNLFSDGILFAGCSYPGNTQDIELSDCGWWYFFAKITELLDTVFFVLRKKQRQISFLHVYHHSVVAAFAWSYLKFAAGGQGAVLGLMNSAVHVVMYSYYLLAALGPALERYLWWKRYVTTMQMVQFVLMVAYCLITGLSPSCNFPKSFTYFITANIVLFFALFLHFYLKNYRMKRGKAPESEASFARKHTEYANGNGNANGTRAADDDDVPVEVDLACGDYVKNGKTFMTKRTAQAVRSHRQEPANKKAK